MVTDLFVYALKFALHAQKIDALYHNPLPTRYESTPNTVHEYVGT